MLTQQTTTFSRTTLLRIVIAGVLLTLIFSLRANASKTLEVLRHANIPYLVIGLAAAMLGEFLTALKWQRLLSGIGRNLGIGFLYAASLVGAFYNNLLPGSLGGDIAKIVLTAPKSGGKAPAAASIFLQRNTGFAGLLVIANFACWVPPLHLDILPERFALLNMPGVWFAAIALIYVAINFVLLSNSVYRIVWRSLSRNHDPGITNDEPSRGLWGRLTAALLPKIQRIHDSLLLFRRGLAVAVLISVITQLIDCFMVYSASRALGLAIPFRNFCVFVPAITLASLAPVTLNGLGLRELGYLVLLKNTGATAEQAVGISLLHFGFLLWLGFVGGVIHWISPSLVPEAREESKRETTA